MTLDNTGKEKDGAPTQSEQETLQAASEQTSATEQLPSKIEVGKQYTGAEVLDYLSADGRVQKDRAEKAEADVKRLTGDVTTLTTNVNTLTGQISEFTKAKNDAEAEAVKDDPVALGSLRARQANAAEALRLQGVAAQQQAEKTKIVTDREAVNTDRISITIKLAATEAGVDEKELADLVPDGNPGRLKKMADILKRSGTTARQSLRGKRPAGLSGRPASTVSAGGSGTLGLSPDEKIQQGLNQQK